jgi:hypothetical protein
LFKRHQTSAVMLRCALALGLVLTMGASGAEARLEGPARADFLRGDFKRCMNASKRHPLGRELSREIVSRLCVCAGHSAADRLTPADAAIVVYGNTAERQRVFAKAAGYSKAGVRSCARASQQRIPL